MYKDAEQSCRFSLLSFCFQARWLSWRPMTRHLEKAKSSILYVAIGEEMEISENLDFQCIP